MLRPRSRQRGAAAVFAAVAIVAGVIAAGLAIDIGRLYFAQRELQRVASLAALDAARVTGGCFGTPENAAETALAEAIGSIGRNSRAGSGIVPARVETGRMARDENGNRYFDPALSSTSHAVRVRLRRPAPGRLLPFFGASTLDELYASAAAQSRPTASLMVGSRLSELNPDMLNRFLSQAFGGPVNLDLLSYQNLLGAEIPLGDVLGPLDLGTPDQVLEIEVPARNLIADLITALAGIGDATARAAAAQIGNALSTTAVVLPSQLLFLEDTVGTALNATMVNAGGLLLSIAQAANGSALLDLPLALPPPLVTGGTRLRIVIPGRQAPDLAPSSPGVEDGGFAANGQAIIESDLGLNLLGVQVMLPLWVEVAQTVATVESIECARRGQPDDIVHVRVQSYASRLGIGRFDDISAPSPRARPARILDVPQQLTVAGIPLPVPVRVTVDVAARVDLPSEQTTLEFRSPWPDRKTVGRPQAATIAAALADVPAALDIDIAVTGPDGQRLPDILNPAIALLKNTLEVALRNQLVGAIAAAGDALLQPVISGIGLSVGGADVQVMSMQNEQPYLFER